MRTVTGFTAGVLAALVLAAPAAAAPFTPLSPAAPPRAAADVLPPLIGLPNGFQPEGIAIGRGTRFYVGSLRDGAIYRGSLRSGRGHVLVPGREGGMAVGTEVDRRGRLFVAGGATGTASVYDATTGRRLAHYRVAPAGAGFVNDVVVTRDAAYLTDTARPFVYVLPLGPRGRLPVQASVRALPLTGELVFRDSGPGLCAPAPNVNVNGIEATPDGRRLIVVQFNTGLLFAVDPATGVTRRLDLGGARLECGDGLLRRGRTLYAVQGFHNRLGVVRLDPSYASGRLVGAITDPDLDVPATVAAFGPFLYAVNGRFTTPPTPDTAYQVVRLPAR